MAPAKLEDFSDIDTIQLQSPQAVTDVPRATPMSLHIGLMLDLQDQVKADRRRTKQLEMQHLMRYHQVSKKLTQLLTEKLSKRIQLADLHQRMHYEQSKTPFMYE
jgi:sRNA-binding protein